MLHFVVPAKGRLSMAQTPTSTFVRVPPNRSPRHLTISSISLVLWVTAATEAIAVLRPVPSFHELGLGDFALLVIFTGGALSGINVAYALVFELWGTEIMALDDDFVELCRGIGWVKSCQRYRLAEVQGPQVVPWEGLSVMGIAVGKSRNGRVAFEHAGHLIRFGDEIDTSEAAWVVGVLSDRTAGHRGTRT